MLWLDDARELRLSCGIVLALGVALASCGRQTGTSGTTLSGGSYATAQACGLEDDQSASLLAPLEHVPVRITVDARMTSDQVEAVRYAANEWNGFARQKLGQNIFQVAVGDVSWITNPKDCGSMEGDLFDAGFPVIREDSESRWTAAKLDSSTPAVTYRCSSSGVLTGQAVYVNTELALPAQLRSILIHELGHAIGLDHSCELGEGKTGLGSCDGLDTDHPYHEAVMYPSLRISMPATGDPEVKETLADNDEKRTQCLY